MATRNHFLGLILSKRYNLLEIVVSFALIASFTAFAARAIPRQIAKELLTQSPLPAVALAVESDSINTKNYAHDYYFTSDWFTYHIPVWEKALASFKGKPGVNYLEVGVYEGRATMWMIDNILTDPSSHLTGIDLFEGDYSDNYGSFKERYLLNLKLSGAEDRAVTLQSYSQKVLRELPLNSFDIVYIDGSHENTDVLEDAVLSWRLLKSGGILIFDDYGSGHSDPKMGIETFVHYFGRHFDVIHNSKQLILKKIS